MSADPADTGDERNPPRQRGRFQRGQSGNPRGRPKGRRSATLAALDAIASEAAVEVVERLVADARAGDREAARLILARVWPPRRGRPVRVRLPPVDGPGGAAAALDALLAEVTAGRLTPGEADAIARLLAARMQASTLADMDQRLAALERQGAERQPSRARGSVLACLPPVGSA